MISTQEEIGKAIKLKALEDKIKHDFFSDNSTTYYASNYLLEQFPSSPGLDEFRELVKCGKLNEQIIIYDSNEEYIWSGWSSLSIPNDVRIAARRFQIIWTISHLWADELSLENPPTWIFKPKSKSMKISLLEKFIEPTKSV